MQDIEFYTGNCPVCRKFAPTYEKVGEMFKKHGNCWLSIIDIDEDQELAQRFRITRPLPKFKFFPTNNKEGIDYTGGLNKKNLITFLKNGCGVSQ